MRFAIGKALILGAAVATAAVTGCSSHDKVNTSVGSPNASIGDVGLQLKVGDLNVNSVHYVLTDGTHTYSGDFNVADAGALVAVIGGVEQTAAGDAGAKYSLTLTATATDGVTPCVGSASGITVVANTTTPVAVELRCTKARTKGSVLINGTVNECPDITSVVGDIAVGCSVPLHVNVTDDGYPTALSYTWTGTGSAGMTGANPVYACGTTGTVSLQVKVSDGDVDPSCAQTFGVTIACPCGGPTCNDGIQNQGETAVDCGGANCAACPTCTDGIKNGTETGVDCGGSCPTACPTCTDGIKNGSETGVDCGGTCGACPTCTDGMKNGTETGVDCGGVSSGVTCPACDTCHNGVKDGAETGIDCGGTCAACIDTLTLLKTINPTANAACGTCAAAIAPGCSLTDFNCELFPAGSTLRTNCYNTLQCVLPAHASPPATVGGSCVNEQFSDLGPCYCGTASGTGCLTAGAANGPCKSVIETGLGSTDPNFIAGHTTDTALGTGMAMQLMSCLADFGCLSCF